VEIVQHPVFYSSVGEQPNHFGARNSLLRVGHGPDRPFLLLPGITVLESFNDTATVDRCRRPIADLIYDENRIAGQVQAQRSAPWGIVPLWP
jgi:hypothetical protein